MPLHAADLTPAPVPAATPAPSPTPTQWEACGWGGGGCFWAVAFHPTKAGVIYMGGDVNGAYKTEDFGRQWRMINNGLQGNSIYTMAVDPKSPETVYAATTQGLAKSSDGGENWRAIPQTGPKQLRITGERGKSIHSIAVDPSNSSIVYAGTPTGNIYKSTDGAETWKLVYQPLAASEDAVKLQFGKVNNGAVGGMWINNPVPVAIKSEDCAGIGFTFKSEGAPLQQFHFVMKTADGGTYRSRDLAESFKTTDWQDVVLKKEDFTLDADVAAKKSGLPASPDFSTVKQASFLAIGLTENAMTVVHLKRILLAVTRTPDGKTGTVEAPILFTGRDFGKGKKVDGSHGNARVEEPGASIVYTVAVSSKTPGTVLGCTSNNGLILSDNAGETWTKLPTPARATSVTISPQDDNILYAAFSTDGLMKSTDKGKTWVACTPPGAEKHRIVDVAVSAADSNEVYCIATLDYKGKLFASQDGGQTWMENSRLKANFRENPTLPDVHETGGMVGLHRAQNLAISPLNSKHLYIAADWRTAFSEDGGKTLEERDRGADISCVSDIEFHKGRAYAAVMDEGLLMSENDGKSWKQLWPRAYDQNVSGHGWQVAVIEAGGVDRILSTFTPWNKKVKNNVMVLSEDGGKTYKVIEAGLPNYTPKANTMWGQGYMRALAADPRNPKILYAGIDGDPEPGKSGGGIFKSEDGGYTWKQLPNQPGSRRMFYGLAVDPTDSKRLYWGAVGPGGGLYRSEDAGNSWKLICKQEAAVFNVVVAQDGSVYCPGKNLWRSTDHGNTWKKISDFTVGKTVVGLAVHPGDSNTIWASSIVWGEGTEGGIYKTTDGGERWQDITGDIPRRNPLILRFNPATSELWAAGVGIYKTKQ
ncbi:MAG: WD40/YVTN/BNR-like repeat-containing protein [Candidatus Methylacidiphilales bacterium]